jgi:predicted PurR-regulated permease PerM
LILIQLARPNSRPAIRSGGLTDIDMRSSEDKFFLLLMVAATLAFGWILLPLYGAVLWGVVIAIIFAPLNRRLSVAIGFRRNLAAVLTVGLIVTIVILPLSAVGASLAQEAGGMYKKIQSGELDMVRLFRQAVDTLPAWVSELMNRFGIASLGALQERLSAGLLKGSEFLAGQAINIGQSTFEFVVNLFVMLYLLFFLLRDGDLLGRRVRRALPLRDKQLDELLLKFNVVIRATVKGNMLIALLQGALGGLIFWLLGISGALLWAVVMAFLSLLPAIGAGLVWIPVALYLLATGAIWQGVTLVAYGALVIGLVDNLLRPILVGKDTKMPDYVVLISTLGGIEVFGLNGFVIGPVIAAMFIAVWDLYSVSRRGAESHDKA